MLVIQRDLALQDRIVGELLQPGGYLKLIELGLEGKQEVCAKLLMFNFVCLFPRSNDNNPNE